MKIIQKVTNCLAISNSNSSIISNFLLKDIDNIKKWNPTYVSKNAYVSKASVTRFAQKLGFEGFVEFVFEFKNELANDRPKSQQEHKLIEDIKQKQINFHKLTTENFDILTKEVSKIDFVNIEYSIKTRRRIIFLVHGISEIFVTQILSEILVKNPNFQIMPLKYLNMDNIKYFSVDDVLINIFISKKTLDHFETLKQLINKGVFIINICHKSELMFEQSYKTLNIGIPEFKEVPKENHFFTSTFISLVLKNISILM